MSEQVGSVTCKKSSDFHGGIRFQSRFTIRWELEDKSFLKIDIICLDDSLKEQYPVSAHAPNFDFWTGCREIKRCEERLLGLEGRNWVQRGRVSENFGHIGDRTHAKKSFM